MRIKNFLWIVPLFKQIAKLWKPASTPLKDLYCLDTDQYFYTLEEVEALREECRLIGASAPAEFWEAPGIALKMCFNGVGPSCWSTRCRTWVSMVLDDCMMMALAHDFETTFSPRTYVHFTVANLRFIVNAVLEAVHRDNIRLLWRGPCLAILCQCFGWNDYKCFDVDTFKKRVDAAIVAQNVSRKQLKTGEK